MSIRPHRCSHLQSRFVTESSVLLVAIVCSVLIPTASPAQSRKQNPDSRNWPEFLGPERNGKSSQKGVLRNWGDGNLKVLWSRSIGESYSAPSVIGDDLFFFERVGRKNTLRRLNIRDGKESWKYEYETDYSDMYGYNNGPRCSPVIDDRLIFVFGPEGQLHAVELETGRLKWKVDTAEKFGVVQNFFGVGSTPVVHKDLLITMVGGSPESSQSVPRGRLDRVEPNGSGIVAFEKKTGKVRYKLGAKLASYSSPVVAKMDGKSVGLAFMREGLIGFHPTNGKQLFDFAWRARMLESVNASTPVVIGNQILISECYGVGGALLQWNEGKLKTTWSDRGGRDMKLSTHWNTPIVIDGYIYASCGRNSGSAELRCLELKTGKVMWVKKGFRRSTLTGVDGHVVLLGEYGELLLFKPNPRKFEQVTRYEPGDDSRLKYPCWAAPVICGGRMYILTRDKLICFQIVADLK